MTQPTKLPAELRAYTVDELFARAERRRRRLATKGGRWGRWRYNPAEHTLEHEDGYWVDLVQPRAFGPIHDAATALDLIAQVAGKSLRFTPHQSVSEFAAGISRPGLDLARRMQLDPLLAIAMSDWADAPLRFAGTACGRDEDGEHKVEESAPRELAAE